MQSGLSRQLSVEDIGVPVLRSNNIVKGHIDLNDIKYWYLNDTKGATTENYFLKKEDLLVNFINSIHKMGKCAVYNDELERPTIFTTNLMRLNFKNDIDTYFIYYFFNTTYYKNYIDMITKPAVNQASFTTVDFKKMDLKIPNIEEQRKISLFLKRVDNKIELLEHKYQKYQYFKKYLMQQIFTQKLRFTNFKEEWENCKFKDLGSVKSGVGFSTKYQGYLDLEYNLYKVSDMNLKGNEKIMVKSNNTIDDFILKEMNAKLITEPSIIFAKVGEAIFLNRKRIVNKPFLIDNNMMAFTPNDKVNIDFMYYLSTTINFGKYAQTGALPSYNASDINTIKCKIPSIEEQEKISNILSLTDEKIDFYNNQLDKTKEFKRGLLQQMFV